LRCQVAADRLLQAIQNAVARHDFCAVLYEDVINDRGAGGALFDGKTRERVKRLTAPAARGILLSVSTGWSWHASC
jgi:hypothetical protein